MDDSHKPIVRLRDIGAAACKVAEVAGEIFAGIHVCTFCTDVFEGVCLVCLESCTLTTAVCW